MVFLIILAVLLCAAAAGSYFACRTAFYSPRGGQNDDYKVIPWPQMDPYRDRVRAMIEKINAIPYEPVEIVSFDGLKLRGRYYRASDGAPLELCFHGYRGTPSRDFSGGAAAHMERGHNVLLVEERAHCGSEGHYITMGVRERFDCAAWVRYAVDRFGPDTAIVLNGISMGAATVLMASGLDLPENVRGVIADCPFTSPAAISKKVLREDMHLPMAVYPFLALGARLFAGFGLREADAAEAVKTNDLPVLLIHGEDDRFVPCDMSRQIAAARPGIRLETFPGAGHGLSFLADEARFTAAVDDFLARVLEEKTPAED